MPMARTYPGAGGWTPRRATGEGGAMALTWWDASQIPGLADGEPVSVWPDARGYRDASEAGSLRPVFRAGVINGRPAVRFDAAQQQGLSFAALAVPESYTLFVAVSKSDPAAHLPVLCNAQGWASLYLDYAEGPWTYASGSTGRIWYWVGALGWHVTSMRVVAGTAPVGTVRRDGVPLLTLPPVDGATWFPLTDIGRRSASAWATGDMAEILLYASALSDGDRLQVEGYLGEKYGIAMGP